VYGSQLANLFPRPKYDGVLGMWYGKGPGVDRTGDVFKHANYAGVSRNGGVLALGGDDPLSKSSTIPSHSEVAFYDALFPVLFPATRRRSSTSAGSASSSRATPGSGWASRS